MLIPLRKKAPPEQVPYVTYGIMALNILVWAFTSQYFLFARRSMVDLLGLSYETSGAAYRFFTSMFMHSDIFHIAGNMLFLWIFGRAVEGRLGTLKFIGLYVLAGLAGASLHLQINGAESPEIMLIGASGAIMGCMGAALFLFPFAPVTFFYMFYYRVGTTDWPMWGAAAWYIGWDLLAASLFSQKDGGVANHAHLGGAGAGFLIPLILQTKRDSAYVSEAKAEVYETRDYSILNRTQLVEMLVHQPKHPEILLHVVGQSRQYGWQIDPEHWKSFQEVLPVIVEEGDPTKVTPLLMDLSNQPGSLPAVLIQRYAERLEKLGQPQPAMELLLRTLRDPQAPASLREAATYRVSVIRDQWLRDPSGAIQSYQNFLAEFPMSSFAIHAQNRIAAIQKSLQA